MNLLRIPSFDRRALPGTVVLMSAALVAGIFFHSAAWSFVCLGIAFLHLLFFRVPHYDLPAGDDPVAPAYGTVADITIVEEKKFLNQEAVRIGIFLSVFNPHVNRSPIDGLIRLLHHESGKFLNAMSLQAAEVNECNWIGIEAKRPIVVRQVAGLIARRIFVDIKQNDLVKRGQNLGIICYSSRTECYLPRKYFKPTLKVGDKVKAGETVLGNWIN